jgi:hypothetical protein
MSPGKADGCGAAFFGIFLLFGLGFSAFFVWPAVRVMQARSWTEVPCEILESRVASHAGEDGSTYSVEVRYRYTVDGREHTSDRYQFLGGSSSGYEGKARVVERLPPGTRTVCYVDPEDPREAVLVRRLTAGYLFVFLPLVFVAVGAGGIFTSVAGLRREKARDGRFDRPLEPGGGPGFEASGGGPSGDRGSLVLEAPTGPVGKFFGATFIAVFWNGIVGVFVWQAWEGWRAGSPDGCLTLFIVPFLLIGALLLINVPYQFLTLFNPRPRVTLTPGRLEPGGSAQLAWSFRGRPGRIRRLLISLDGTEETEEGQGDDRTLKKEPVGAYELLDTSLPLEIAGGSTHVSIPPDARPSLMETDRRVVWTLKVSGEIRFWPDVAEEIQVTVHPNQVR